MTMKSIQPNPATWHRVVAVLFDSGQCLQSIKHLDEGAKRTLHASICNLWRHNAQFCNSMAHAIAKEIREEDELAAWLEQEEARRYPGSVSKEDDPAYFLGVGS